MQTHEANLIALGGCAKAVRLALKRLGMRRCSLRLVYYQTEPRDGLRLDWYGVFWRWFEALWMAHRAGAEFLLDDFLARVAELREVERGAAESRCCWRTQVVRCETESSDIVKAAVLNDLERLKRETVEAIGEQRRLLAILERESHQQRAA